MCTNMKILVFTITITIALAAVINSQDDNDKESCAKVGEKVRVLETFFDKSQ